MSAHDSHDEPYLLKELSKLRDRLKHVESENQALRASIWELSWRIDPRHVSDYFDIPSLESAVSKDQREAQLESLAASRASDGSKGISDGTNWKEEKEEANNSQNPVSQITPSMRQIPQAHSESNKEEDAQTSTSNAAHEEAEPVDSEPSQQQPKIVKKDFAMHDGSIYQIKFAPVPVSRRQNLIASGGLDGIYIMGASPDKRDKDEWDWLNASPLLHLNTHIGPVSDIAFSHDSRWLLSGGFDGFVKISDVHQSLKATGSLWSVDDEDGNEENTKADDRHGYYHAHQRRQQQQQQQPVREDNPSVSALPFVATLPDPFSSSTNISTYDQSVWSQASEGLVLSVAWLPPSQSAASSSGNLFVWGTSGRMVFVGDLRQEKPVLAIEMPSAANTLCPLKDAPYLRVGDADGFISIVSLETGNIISRHQSSPSPISFINAPSTQTEPRWLAQVSYDNVTKIFDQTFDGQTPSDIKSVLTLKGHNRNWPIGCVWLDTSEGISTGSDVSSGPTRKASQNSVSKSTLLLVTGSSNGSVFLHDASELLRSSNPSLAQVPTKQISAHQGAVCAVDLVRSGDNIWLASGGQDSIVSLWKM